MKRLGIRTTGKLRAIHWPQQETAQLARPSLLGEVPSPPLHEIVQRGLKRSQNLYMQNLLLAVGASQPLSTPGFRSSENRALDASRQRLERIGIAASSSLIEEGAGLSRHELVTPEAMVRLLGYLAARPCASMVCEALPIAGVDGTLTTRMRGTAAANNVLAKTGSMSQVQCLAGYGTAATGERLAFAIMLNNYERPATHRLPATTWMNRRAAGQLPRVCLNCQRGAEVGHLLRGQPATRASISLPIFSGVSVDA